MKLEGHFSRSVLTGAHLASVSNQSTCLDVCHFIVISDIALCRTAHEAASACCTAKRRADQRWFQRKPPLLVEYLGEGSRVSA